MSSSNPNPNPRNPNRPKRTKQVANRGRSERGGTSPSSPSPPPPARAPIRFRNKEQRDRYTILESKRFFVNRQFDWEYLRSIGISRGLESMIDSMGWTQFAALNLPAYKEIVLEFLSSVSPIIPDEDVLKYRVFNREISVDMSDISETLKLPNSGYSGYSSVRGHNFDPDRVWRRISHRNERFEAGKAKASLIRSPSLRLFHRFISHTINCRRESNDAVHKDDIFVIWCYLEDISFDATTWLTERFIRMGSKPKANLSGCGYITLLAIGHLPPDSIDIRGLEPLPFIESTDIVGKNSLFGAGLIKPGGQDSEGNTIWVSSVSDADEVGAILDDRQADALSSTPPPPPTKRTRTEDPIPTAEGTSSASENPLSAQSFMTQVLDRFDKIDMWRDSIDTWRDSIDKRFDSMEAAIKKLQPSTSPDDG